MMKSHRLIGVILSVLLLSSCEFSFGSSTSSPDPVSTSSMNDSSETSEISTTTSTDGSSTTSVSISSSMDSEMTPYDIYLLAVTSGYEGNYDDWLNSVRGTDGRRVELSIDANYIYWRYDGDVNWTILIDIASLRGAQGLSGENGIDGLSPHIGEDGNWWLGEENLGIATKGTTGADGEIPYVGENGNWWIGQDDTGVVATGLNGLSAYEVFIANNPAYEGDEQEWLQELLTGEFSSQTYVVTFDTAGGTPIASQIIKAGLPAQKPEHPTKLGHILADWYLGDERWIFVGFAVTEDITLTAHWQAVAYTISYELYGGENHPDNVLGYAAGTTYSFLNASRLAYQFGGWFLDAGFTEPITTITSDMATDLTLHAKWVSQPGYTIDYILNGGTNDASNLTFVTDSINTFGPSAPIRTGYIFDGWYLEDTYETVLTSINPSTLSQNITLYAKWTPINTTPLYDNYVVWDPLVDGVFFRDGSSAKILGILRISPTKSGYYRMYSNLGGASKEGTLYDANGNQIKYARDNNAIGIGFVMRAYLLTGHDYYLVSSNVSRYDTAGWTLYTKYDGIDPFDTSVLLSLDTSFEVNDYSSSKLLKHYRFIPKLSGYYQLSSSADLSTEAGLYNYRQQQLVFDQGSGPDGQFQIVYYFHANVDYYFQTSFETPASTGQYYVSLSML